MYVNPLGGNSQPLASLIEQCRQQTDLFLRFLPSDNSSCFEICRFAFEARNEEAWVAFYSIYTPLVQQWLKRSTINWSSLKFDEVELVQGSFTRIFRGISPEKFQRFSSLPALMEYLKLCCRAEVMSSLREYQKNKRYGLLSAFESELEDNSNPYDRRGTNLTGEYNEDKTRAEMLDQADLWELICKILKNSLERLVVLSQYFHGMTPREILRAYPGFFKNIDEVRQVLRNARYKLRNSEELKNWLKDSSK